MKKLLTLAAIALATVSLQAATTSWGWEVAGLNWDDGTDGDSVTSGFVELVYAGSTMDKQNVDDIGNATGTITGDTTDDAFKSGAEWNAIVQVDIKGQTYKQTFTFTMPSGLNGDAQNDYAKYADLNAAITDMIQPNGYFDPATMANDGWVAIPEPTSVALLALGLAALGLKRKIA